VILIVSGTFSHVRPRSSSAAASVRSTPVENAPTAPYEQVWLSLPTMTWPGRAMPFSTTTWWQMPWPTS
jgi:hypothetical protein